MSKRHHTHKRERQLRVRTITVIALSILVVAGLAALLAMLIGGIISQGMP